LIAPRLPLAGPPMSICASGMSRARARVGRRAELAGRPRPRGRRVPGLRLVIAVLVIAALRPPPAVGGKEDDACGSARNDGRLGLVEGGQSLRIAFQVRLDQFGRCKGRPLVQRNSEYAP